MTRRRRRRISTTRYAPGYAGHVKMYILSMLEIFRLRTLLSTLWTLKAAMNGRQTRGKNSFVNLLSTRGGCIFSPLLQKMELSNTDFSTFSKEISNTNQIRKSV